MPRLAEISFQLTSLEINYAGTWNMNYNNTFQFISFFLYYLVHNSFSHELILRVYSFFEYFSFHFSKRIAIILVLVLVIKIALSLTL